MKEFWVKLTNCNTTTGGGKGKPIRSRNNQNIHLRLNENIINTIGLKRYIFERYGKEYWTTYESKAIIIRELN